MAGPGKRGKRQEPPPEPVPIPAPEQPLAVAPSNTLTPALEGAEDALNFVGLRRTSIRFGFAYDTSALEGLGADEQVALWRHLAADPRWRVSQQGDIRFAEQRVQTDGQWFVGLGGYHIDDNTCHRIALRDHARDAGTPWARSDLVGHGPVGRGEVELRVFALLRNPCIRQQAVALSVDGSVSLEVFESGNAESLPWSTRALTEDMTFILNATIDPDSVGNEGYEVRALGSALPTQSFIDARPVKGGVSVAGADNPGEAGSLWVRMLVDGAPHQAAEFGVATLEQVGWSTKADEYFPWQSVVPLPENTTFSGVAEVWFAPKSGAPRLLRSGPLQIEAGS